MNAEHENEDGTREENRELGATNHHNNRLGLGTLRPYFKIIFHLAAIDLFNERTIFTAS